MLTEKMRMASNILQEHTGASGITFISYVFSVLMGLLLVQLFKDAAGRILLKLYELFIQKS